MELALADFLIFSSALFAVGAAGLVARRSLLFMLASIEVMFAAAGVAFVGAARALTEPAGEAVYLFALAAAAAQVSVGLALLISLRGGLGGIDADRASSLRG